MDAAHLLFIAFATHGHFNPGLHFAHLLARRGLHITFASSVSVLRRLPQPPAADRLSFASFSDGYDDGFKPGHHDIVQFLSDFERHGSEAVKNIIVSAANAGRPFTFVVYSLIIPWVAEVARSLHVPSALLWNQAASVFNIYYHFFNGYEDQIRKTCENPSQTIQLPGLPLLSGEDLPSHFHPSSLYTFGLPLFRKHFQVLEQEPHPIKVLVNSFEELEHDALKNIANINLIPIGPLLPVAVYNPPESSYIDWLNSNDQSSVVYVSFGSLATLSKKQTEEIARGLLDSGRPFLWVTDELNEDDELSCRGKVVSWCSQMEVLSNPAIGCFVSHCGWNSSLESLVCGVLVVAFPQWTDQMTNAKIVGELTGTGVRLKTNQSGVVEGEEIRRCLDLVMGDTERGEELRRNAGKWKEAAIRAAVDGGSSFLNLGAFVDEVCKRVEAP